MTSRDGSTTKRKRHDREEELAAEEENDEDQQQQSVRQRRKLRADYRRLMHQIAGCKGELEILESKKFNNLHEDIKKLYSKVQKPREQIADAEAVLNIASTLLEVVQGAKRKTGISSSEFVGALVSKYGVSSMNSDSENECRINWGLLGLDSAAMFNTVSGLCTMLGPMEIVQKVRKVPTSRRRQEKPSQVTKPEEVTEADGTKQETDANMEIMFGKLRSAKSIALDALVLNRSSFSQTVENLFSLSFLVKDGRAAVNYASDGTHLIVPRNAPTAVDRARGVTNTQFVFRFDFESWKVMKSRVDEGTEVMPHRPNHEASGVSQTPVRKHSRNRAQEMSAIDDPNADAVSLEEEELPQRAPQMPKRKGDELRFFSPKNWPI
ncbi:hypothetical protein BDL97_16G074700 [Sphagnum fallax]|nr:hypothetical protein BDL97_16G074700 [Sphagnum fallax]